MPLLTARDLTLSYGDTELLAGAELHLERGERVGLVGLNGSGKTTLLRVLAGDEAPDRGELAWRSGVQVAWLPQIPVHPPQSTLREVAMAGAARNRLVTETFDQEIRADLMLSHLGVPDPTMRVAEASGGTRRRAALAAALLEEADLLLLDEPTNHLDVQAAGWLQEHLRGLASALVLVTHDRYFLDAVVDRIVEVRKQRLWSWPGNYADFLEAQMAQEALEARVEQNRRRLYATELEWLRRSPQARSTKQKARVQRAEAMSVSDHTPGRQVALSIEQDIRPGKTILEAHGLQAGYVNGAETAVVVAGLDLVMARGNRIGIIGPNGAGKTTLLRTLALDLAPLAGTVRHGLNTRLLYIDQERSGLDPAATVRDAATPSGGDWVEVGGERLHVASWLDRFLFRGADLQQKVATLSGGQRFRLLLALRLQEGRNLLVLDEPTNDLDFETLAILEEALVAYGGCLLVVSHDRCFLDRVCTHVLHLPGDGSTELHAGGYSAWAARMATTQDDGASSDPQDKAPRPRGTRAATPAPPKLTLAEESVLERIEETILQAEDAVAQAEAAMADPSIATDHQAMLGWSHKHTQACAHRDACYETWQQLEARRDAWNAWRQAQQKGGG